MPSNNLSHKQINKSKKERRNADLAYRTAFKTNWKDLLIFIAIGVCLFGTGTAYFIAMQVTSVSTAVVLMYTAPIYVLIFSVLFLGEKLSLPKGLAVAGMLVGKCGWLGAEDGV